MKIYNLGQKALLTGLFFLLLASTSLAVGVSPVTKTFTVAPGDTVNGELKVYSTESVPSKYSVNLQDYYFSKEQNTKIFVDEFLPRGLHKWLKLEETEVTLDPGESHVFKYTISVPADAAPGTYSTAFSAGGAASADGSSFGMLARAVSYVDITIEGDYKEELELISFGIDSTAFLKGEVVFVTKVKNIGDVSLAPKGTITIYNQDGEQLKGISPTYQNINGNQIEVGRSDELLFNQSLITALPEEEHAYMTPWENRKIEPGKYTVKLKMFYGEEESLLESETSLEIVKDFLITDLSAKNYFNSSLPISFSAKLKNTGTSQIKPTGFFEIKNIFGSQKKRIDLSEEELLINSGEEKVLNNMVWADGFAMGYYTATLNINIGEKLYTESTSFLVLGLIQSLIGLAILVLIIFIIVKMIKTYIKLKKRLEETEKNKK